MDFGQIKNKFLEVLGVTILKTKNIHNFLLGSPFFLSVTLPEHQNPQNLRAWFIVPLQIFFVPIGPLKSGDWQLVVAPSPRYVAELRRLQALSYEAVTEQQCVQCPVTFKIQQHRISFNQLSKNIHIWKKEVTSIRNQFTLQRPFTI